MNLKAGRPCFTWVFLLILLRFVLKNQQKP